MKLLAPLFAFASLITLAFAQQKPQPEIKYSTLRALLAGTKTTFTLCGERLDFASAKCDKPNFSVKILSVKPSEGDFKKFGSQQVALEAEAGKECKSDTYTVSLTGKDGGKASVDVVVLDAVESVVAVKRPISETAKAAALTGASWFVSESFAGGNADYFRFEGKAGERWEIRVSAGRVGSTADVMLRVRDSRRIALAMSAGIQKHDRKLLFTVPRDGTYTLELSDIDLRGGKEFSYGLWGRRL